jgi:hypothetical protein
MPLTSQMPDSNRCSTQAKSIDNSKPCLHARLLAERSIREARLLEA